MEITVKPNFLAILGLCFFVMYGHQVKAQKSVADVGNVPGLGSGSTEAGVNTPGVASGYYYTPGATRDRPGMQTGQSPNTGYVSTDFSSGNGALGAGYTTALGVANLFAQSLNLAARVAPRAGNAPMFFGECPFCQSRNPAATESTNSDETATSTDETAVNPDGSPTEFAIENAHNPSLIRQLVNSEDLGAFVGLDDEAREARINDVITSLDPYGGLVFRNTDEYKQMCPNFENLNANQRKAFMVFLYSEVFKQTSAYEYDRRTTSNIEGVEVTRVGLCQISYPEYTQVQNLYAENFSGSGQAANQEVFEREYAINPLSNITVCSALIFNRTESVATGSNPIRNMFPNVDFNPIETKLKNLKLCRN